MARNDHSLRARERFRFGGRKHVGENSDAVKITKHFSFNSFLSLISNEKFAWLGVSHRERPAASLSRTTQDINRAVNL
jgi:hypothetical protein